MLRALLPRSMRSRLVLALGAVATLAVLIVTGIQAVSEAQRAREDALNDTMAIASLVAVQVENRLVSTQYELAAFAANPQVIAAALAADADTLTTQLAAMAPSDPNLTGITAVNTEGVVWATSLSDKSSVGTDQSAERQVREALDQGVTSIGQPRLGVRSRLPILPIGAPIFGPDRRPVGVLVGALSLDKLTEQVRAIRVGKGGYISVLSEEGLFLAHPDRSLLLAKTSGTNQAIVQALRGNAAAVETRNRAGNIAFAAAVPVPGLGWVVGAQIPVEESFEPLRRQLVRSAAAAGLAIAVAVAVGLIIARGLTKPIAALRQATRNMSQGRYDPSDLDIRTGDELEELAADFTAMAEQREQAHAEILALNGELEQRVARRTAELQQMLQSVERERREKVSLLESTGEGIYGIDREGRCTFLNRAGAELLGYTPEETLRQNMHELVHSRRPDGSPYPEEDSSTSHALATGQGTRVEDDFLWRRDGTGFPVQFSSFPIREGTEITGAVVTFTDISEQKQTQATLRESEELFRNSFHHTAVGKAIAALDGHWLQVNQALCDFTGFSEQELLAMKFADITHPDDLGLSVEHNRRLSAGEISSYQLEKRYRHKSGGAVWALTTVTAVSDDAGNPRYHVGEIQNITAQKLAEESAREGEARLRLSQQQLEDAERLAHLGHWTWDATTNQSTCSDEQYRMFGLDPEVRPNISFEDIVERVHPEDRERVREVNEQALRDGKHFQYVARFRREDGSLRTLESKGVPVLDASGAVVRLLGTSQDITERRQTEDSLRQAVKMEAVGVLAGGVAHDFNNLLTVINGCAELLRLRFDAGDERATLADEIIKAGERAAALTTQLLAFSRQQMLQPKELDVNAVVADMGTLLRRLIGEDVELSMDLGPELASVYADPGQLGQVLLNLAVNARDAMPRGGRLTIETRNVEIEASSIEYPRTMKPGSYVLLAVSDTGIGMDAATQSRIFEPFFTTKEQGKGTGLGLSTVFGIVKQSDGEVSVYSEPGTGTTFKIYLPRFIAAAKVSVAPSAPATLPRGSETVLLVEDEDGVRALVKLVLTNAGYRVLVAADPSEAVQLATKHTEPIHLLLTDVVMPVMSGRELAEQLLPTRPEMRVLYMSGYTPDVAVRHGVIEATVSFVQKPVTPAALMRKVREVLDATELAAKASIP